MAVLRSWLSRGMGALGGALLVATPATSTPAAAEEVGNWVTFHGCIVTINDEYVVLRVQGAGRGPGGVQRFARNASTQVDSSVDNDGCVAVAAWQEDG